MSDQQASTRDDRHADRPPIRGQPAGARPWTRTLTPATPGRVSRHPAEVPFFVVMVVLNLAIVLVIVRSALVVPFLPAEMQDSGFANTVRAALVGLLLFVPALIVVREVQRASVLGTAVQLSERQFPALYGTAQEFAEALGLGRRPVVYLANGNGALNAFAAQAAGQDYVVVSSELFAHLREENRDGLRFILGHEMAHIRLHHVSLWYQLAVAYSQRIPILGPTLSRLREYSCDRLGRRPGAAGRRGPRPPRLRPLHRDRGRHRAAPRPGPPSDADFWVGLAQLPRSHPFTVRRLERLVGLGLLSTDPADRDQSADPTLRKPA